MLRLRRLLLMAFTQNRGCSLARLWTPRLASFLYRFGSRLRLEVDLAGFPLLAGFNEHGADQSQQGGLVRKERGDASAPFDLLV